MEIHECPFVTVIMPVRNEKNYIGGALQSVLNQDYPPDQLEIIVIDGNSDDGTVKVVSEFQGKFPNILLINNPGQIVPIGMNIALPLAKGKVVVRVDGHCLLANDYITNCVGHLLIDKVEGVGGPMKTIGETSLSETIALAMSSKFGVGGSAFRTEVIKTAFVDTVPFPAYTIDIIEKAGGYDEELVRNQDDEYNYRIRELGGKILLAGDVQSKYYSRGSLAKLWKQYFQYGYWKVRVFQKHPFQMSVRQFIPPLFVSLLIFLLLLAPFLYWGRLLFVFVVAAYLSASLIASTVTAVKNGWNHFVALPICYAILHISYGAGFITGLVKFVKRWGDKKGKVPELRIIHASRN